ncbi:GNAT family N-acetyltransferase [Streptomyces sp. NPDC001393]
MITFSDLAPTPPEPVLNAGWELRPIDEPATASPQAARTYTVTPAGGGPTALLRVHRVPHHPLHACYPFGAHDLAVGLDLSDPGAPGQVLASQLLRAFVSALFAADSRCRRIVAAPDESDTVTQVVLEAGGFRRVAEADLPDASVVLYAAEPPDITRISTALDDMPH